MAKKLGYKRKPALFIVLSWFRLYPRFVESDNDLDNDGIWFYCNVMTGIVMSTKMTVPDFTSCVHRPPPRVVV